MAFRTPHGALGMTSAAPWLRMGRALAVFALAAFVNGTCLHASIELQNAAWWHGGMVGMVFHCWGGLRKKSGLRPDTMPTMPTMPNSVIEQHIGVSFPPPQGRTELHPQ